MVRVLWSLENAGSTIAFDPTVPKDYLKAAGASGLGVAPTSVVLAPSVRGGSTWRSSKRNSRVITFPVVTFGDDADDVETKLRALIRALDDTYTTPRLVAKYPDGRLFDTEVHYSGGADHQYGSDDTDGTTFCRWVLQLTAPDPYFTSRAVTEFEIGTQGGRGLIRPGGSFSKLRLTSSQALGAVAVNNPGDVEAWPIIQIYGPGTSFTAQRAVDGASFVLTTPFTNTNPVTIDTRAKTVIDATGANRYGGMVGAPRLFSLPPGQSTIRVALQDATTGSRASLQFAERRELIFG